MVGSVVKFTNDKVTPKNGIPNHLSPQKTENTFGKIFRKHIPINVPKTQIKTVTQKYSARHKTGFFIGNILIQMFLNPSKNQP